MAKIERIVLWFLVATIIGLIIWYAPTAMELKQNYNRDITILNDQNALKEKQVLLNESLRKYEQDLKNLQGIVSSLNEFSLSLNGIPESIEELRNASSELSETIQRTETNFYTFQYSLPEENVILDVTQPGFQVIRNKLGVLFLAAEKATPYVDGFNITLQVGNPFDMTMNDFKFKVSWGTSPPAFPMNNESNPTNYLTDYNNWQASLREKEISVTTPLLPGTWNPINFVLSPAKPEEIKYIKVHSIFIGAVSFK